MFELQVELEVERKRSEELRAERDALQGEVDEAAEQRVRGRGTRQFRPDPGYRCVVDGDGYAVDGAVLDDFEASLSRVRLVPSYRDGRAEGFKMYGLRDDSLPASCGFHNADVITAVNGLPIATPADALDAYAQLQSEHELTFTVQRRDEILELTIRTPLPE